MNSARKFSLRKVSRVACLSLLLGASMPCLPMASMVKDANAPDRASSFAHYEASLERVIQGKQSIGSFFGNYKIGVPFSEKFVDMAVGDDAVDDRKAQEERSDVKRAQEKESLCTRSELMKELLARGADPLIDDGNNLLKVNCKEKGFAYTSQIILGYHNAVVGAVQNAANANNLPQALASMIVEYYTAMQSPQDNVRLPEEVQKAVKGIRRIDKAPASQSGIDFVADAARKVGNESYKKTIHDYLWHGGSFTVLLRYADEQGKISDFIDAIIKDPKNEGYVRIYRHNPLVNLRSAHQPWHAAEKALRPHLHKSDWLLEEGSLVKKPRKVENRQLRGCSLQWYDPIEIVSDYISSVDLSAEKQEARETLELHLDDAGSSEKEKEEARTAERKKRPIELVVSYL